ncbi:MAG: pseudouridine synthase family protein [Phycisphaerales bacterium]
MKDPSPSSRSAAEARGARNGLDGRGVTVLFQQDLEAAVYKPAGLSSERTGGGVESDSLAIRAARSFGWNRCWLPHRLDRATRGVMMVAGSPETVAAQNQEIRAGLWTKWYVARIVAGEAESRSMGALLGEHRAFLRREGRLARVVRSGGDPSRMAVLAIAPAPRHATAPGPSAGADDRHVLVRLDTGRYHQIRVMLSHLGFPIVGDAEYGSRRTWQPIEGGGAFGRGGPGAVSAIDLEAVALHIARPSGPIVVRSPHLDLLDAGLREAIERAIQHSESRSA